ncbi:hypothetical protein A2781_00475 [Candidatus Gottesmanbacteria bacterium RIFCSPHIGHO2_01_FULL_42_27]|uniref:Uncharacterized protein n=2 Tax=Candidatus Gottesmaniibacteriota TaxID=1752720 RepID=A0A0G1HK28_9BACT|nr:MAG: hypothetical protein UV46_C0071G0003 [Candidatus Gottesmanbacteria bacterium GW2011_GWC2_42_8]KKT47551.1 MAG: hypothetical protein UW37_C0006G0014 [Candidatus Gottesmanbacteria bacterium GW2011_GWA2_44_17]OGG12330.1 MAG: hypothetical protein A2781_00475 [Candidatus Gottesmanbacteria bacterium RIFCSPHIGHO2_01_FULL_42_27]OGG22423.1 MAG: hypothetical protein A3E72_01050 [Candidatus Gottesmanbacteria bacterium RIFCSPHIGHO2_12_FULL_43_26]OGG32994.1 MAG: hypothetical protein A3G68_06915 [Cand
MLKSRLEIFADLFTNLAAGWFGAIVIFPNLFHFNNISELVLSLTLNFSLGLLSLLLAFYFKDKKE